MTKQRTLISILQSILALVGFGIASFLFREHVTGSSIPCMGGGGGCDLVDHSSYSVLFGIPVSAFGAAAYMLILLAAVVKLTTDNQATARRAAALIAVITTSGCGISWVYQWIARYLIGAFCIWCRSSAVDMSVLFIVSVIEVIILIRTRPSTPIPGDFAQST